PRPQPRGLASSRVLEGREVNAILEALDKQTATRALGPRAVRAFLFRYQLARLLLNTLGIDWKPGELAKSLAERAFGVVGGPATVSVGISDEQKVQRIVDQVC